jgi:hypothetical protein
VGLGLRGFSSSSFSLLDQDEATPKRFFSAIATLLG